MKNEIKFVTNMPQRNRSLVLLIVCLTFLFPAGISWAQEVSGDGLWTGENLSHAAYVGQPGPAVRFSSSRVNQAALEGLLASAPRAGQRFFRLTLLPLRVVRE